MAPGICATLVLRHHHKNVPRHASQSSSIFFDVSRTAFIRYVKNANIYTDTSCTENNAQCTRTIRYESASLNNHFPTFRRNAMPLSAGVLRVPTRTLRYVEMTRIIQRAQENGIHQHSTVKTCEMSRGTFLYMNYFNSLRSLDSLKDSNYHTQSL